MLAASALHREVSDVSLHAPAGHVIEHCEKLVLDQGEELLRRTFQAAVQQPANETPKRGARPYQSLRWSPAKPVQARTERPDDSGLIVVRLNLRCQTCQLEANAVGPSTGRRGPSQSSSGVQWRRVRSVAYLVRGWVGRGSWLWVRLVGGGWQRIECISTGRLGLS